MTTAEYKRKLNEVYANFYGTDTPQCKYCEETRKKFANKCKYSFDRAKVGGQYGEDPRIPRIMMVGLESKHADKQDYIIQEIETPSRSASNAHYRGARYVLAYLLSTFYRMDTPKSTSSANLHDYEFMTEKYVLTNLYKCAFGEPNQVRNLFHFDDMRRYCQELFFAEIEAAEPDVVVIQAVNNHPENFWANILERFSDGKENCLIGDGKYNRTSAYRMRLSSGQPFLMIFTYHGAWPPFAGKRYLSTLNTILDAAIAELKERFCID
ncbi:MAG: hypothetical protein J1F24_04305 [Oscillospiraceae bacterium]|nr:hypothetical protein [Oscillospiraceae bacterium]